MTGPLPGALGARAVGAGSPTRSGIGRALDRAALAVCVLAGIAASLVAPRYTAGLGLAPPAFYQDTFAPAVMMACGRGYVNLADHAVPALDEFLQQRRRSLACSDIPADAPRAELLSFQRISINLQAAAAVAFWFGGISWGSLAPVYGALGAAMGGLLYALFRMGSGPLLSALATLLLLVSPVYLVNVIHLRDFAKAPFLLAAILAIGRLVRRSGSHRSWVWTAALIGAVLGLGLGFRNDVMIALPPLVITMVLLAPPEIRMARRLAAAAAFVAAFLVVASPTLAAYSKGSNTAHVILLGLTPAFDAPLGIEPAPYQISTLYRDEQTYVTVRSEATRVHGAMGQLGLGSAPYDRAATDYLLHVLALTPADFATRALAAVAGVLRTGYAPFGQDPPVPGAIDALLVAASVVLSWLRPFALPAAALVFVALALSSWRHGAAALLVVGVFAGGAALQFHPRHYFYLACLGYWPVTASLSALVRLPGRLLRGKVADAWPARDALAGATLIVAAVVVTVGGLALLRHYQAGVVGALLRAYAAAPATTVPVTITPGDASTSRLLVDPGTLFRDGPEQLYRQPVSTAFLRVRVGGPSCSARTVPIRTAYVADTPSWDFATAHQVDLPDNPTTIDLFVPVYRSIYPARRFIRHAAFAGFDVPSHLAPCIQSVARVEDLSSFPILLNAEAPGRAGRPLYQRLPLELPRDPAVIGEAFYLAPSTADTSSRVIGAPSVGPLAFAYTSPDARADGAGWRVDGFRGGQYEYVLATGPVPSSASHAVVRGLIESGGITVGLLDARGKWGSAVNVTRRGPFTVVLGLPEERPVRLVVANCGDNASDVTRFRLDTLALVAAAGASRSTR